MGLALSWIPPLVIASVVDRNLTATKDLRRKFNVLLADVRQMLDLEIELRGSESNNSEEPTGDVHRLVEELAEEFFVEFAGQGRVHWHRGVASSILASVEKYAKSRGNRDWLPQSKGSLISIDVNRMRGFDQPDYGSVWQAIGAMAVIYGNIFCGFAISYITPTVGVGCRSGGYMIFAILTMSVSILELTIWRLTQASSKARNVGLWCVRAFEFINTCWLIWITLAQTFGFYQTCECLSSAWDPRAGYIHFDHEAEDVNSEVEITWITSTVVACCILILSLGYIIVEWCLQSHMATLSYAKARCGLTGARRFRRVKRWLLMVDVRSRLSKSFGRGAARSRTDGPDV